MYLPNVIGSDFIIEFPCGSADLRILHELGDCGKARKSLCVST